LRKSIFYLWVGLCLGSISVQPSYAETAVSEGLVDSFVSALRKETQKYFGGAEVIFSGSVRWVQAGLPDSIGNISIYGDDGRGNLHFVVENVKKDQTAEGWVQFTAWVSARIAMKRIHPGQILTSDLFNTQKINISTGIGREFRGIIFPAKNEIKGLEAIQSILEGQFLVSSAVQRSPDVRRGDLIQVRLISGDVILSTSGIAEESGYISKKMRIMTTKGKRELLGLLKAGSLVEVKI